MTTTTTDIKIHYDGKLDIATAKNRHEDTWRNRQILWSKLVSQCSQTHRTHETFAEYLAAKKSVQDEIKDVGGFVGGYLTNGRRKTGNVAHRQLITLDLDHATSETWFAFTQLFDCAAACYSTHKHSPDAPRLRILIPLTREVFSDEYVAIARWVAGEIGIENFDPTCFRPTQLMYWPSSSKDADYFFAYQDEPWLDADQILNNYHNWKDSSEWPTSERENDIAFREIKKQGDPLEKPGIVGTFCRTYTLSEAIENFLGDVYESTGDGNRYTFKAGSTAGGLVVYDDKFAYSHHGTDPVSGKLCNAFDLVRLHLFGLKDEDAKPGTPGNKLPSYTAMLEHATKDPLVRRQIGSEKINEALSGFDDDYSDGELSMSAKDASWLEKMEVDKKGNYLSTINNVLLIMENDPRLAGRFGLNEFGNSEEILGALPWRKFEVGKNQWTDADDAALRHYMEKNYGIVSAPKIKDAFDIITRQNRFHPVRDYLNALTWDRKPRLEKLLIEYLGAEDSDYVRAVTKKTLTAGVARIFTPGLKFDYALVLSGPQGCGKSSLLHKLGREWFSDSLSLADLGHVRGDERLRSIWLMEIPELAGLKKAEVEVIKAFFSRTEDRYRPSYGKRVEIFPRQCFFIGTTNDDTFLRDLTGNRRFWPVAVKGNTGKHPTTISSEEIGQIWAEAVCVYRAGEPLYLSPELEMQASQQQSRFSIEDPRIGILREYLETKLPSNWEDLDTAQRRYFLSSDDSDDSIKPSGAKVRLRVCAAEIASELFGLQRSDLTTALGRDIAGLMSQIQGWNKSPGTRRFKIYGEQRCWVRSANGAEDNGSK